MQTPKQTAGSLMANPGCETDFTLGIPATSTLLQQQQWTPGLILPNLIEEIELGKTNNVQNYEIAWSVLIGHLLEWEYYHKDAVVAG